MISKEDLQHLEQLVGKKFRYTTSVKSQPVVVVVPDNKVDAAKGYLFSLKVKNPYVVLGESSFVVSSLGSTGLYSTKDSPR